MPDETNTSLLESIASNSSGLLKLFILGIAAIVAWNLDLHQSNAGQDFANLLLTTRTELTLVDLNFKGDRATVDFEVSDEKDAGIYSREYATSLGESVREAYCSVIDSKYSDLEFKILHVNVRAIEKGASTPVISHSLSEKSCTGI